MYEPSDFGVLSIYTSLLSILLVISALRYELAIPLPKKEEEAVNLLALCLILVFVVSGLTFLLLFILTESNVSLGNAEKIKPFFWVLPISILGMGIYQSLLYWNIRKKEFTIITKTKFIQAINQSTVSIILGLCSIGSLGLLLGDSAGRIGIGSRLARLLFISERHILKSVNIKGIIKVAKRYKKFPLLSSWSSVINVTGLQLPAILLAYGYGQNIAGYFILGQRIIAAPIMLIGQAISQVYFAEMTNLVREKSKRIYQLLFNIIKKLFIFSLLPSVLLGLFGNFVFKLLFGAQWEYSGVIVQILSPMFLIYFVVYPLSQTLNIIERHDLQLFWDCLRLILVICVFSLAKHLNFSVVELMVTYSIIMSLCYILLAVLILYSIRKYINRTNSI